MSIFSTNQARHLYVATALKSPNVIASDAAGSIAVKVDNAKNHMYFEYIGQGGLTRSDLIDIKSIMYAKATEANKMARDLKTVKVSLNADPVEGQDYILKLVFRQFSSISDEDIYTKFGMVHAVNGMSKSDFYKELALSLVKNFSREAEELVRFALTSAGAEGAVEYTELNPLTKNAELTGEYDSLVIYEVEQDWVLGTKPQRAVYFDVLPGTITMGASEVIWGSAEAAEAKGTVKNGKLIADLEYFCMGERGDQYRGIGWPNIIPTKYMVDASKEYHVLDIHYAYVGSNESVQKSEKDITIVCADKAELNKIVEAVNSAAGLSIASL